MATRFHRIDYHVHDILMEADRQRGMTPYELAKAARISFVLLFGPIDRLQDGGFIEMRWQGERWPNGDAPNDEGLTSLPGERHSLYRITSRAKQTLVARIQSKRES